MFEKIKEIKDMFETARQRVRENGRRLVMEAFQELFAAHPNIQAVRWTQYTPGFNDGDPCTFRLGEWEARIVGLRADGEPVSNEYDEDSDFDDCYGCSENPDVQAIDELWAAISNKDLMEYAFGDPVRVTVTPTELSVEEYDCGY